MDALTLRCQKCGKQKKKSNFSKTPFLEDNHGYELYCRTCKNKMIKSKDDLKNYLEQHNIQYNEATYKDAYDTIREREQKKLDDMDEIPLDFEEKYFKKIIGKYFSLINLTGEHKATVLNESIIIKSGKTEISEEMIDKWGYGHDPSLYPLFENKYQRLKNTYQLPTESHKEFLMKACVCSVKADIAMAEGNVKEAKDWIGMFTEISKAGKLQPSQMSKADLSQGMETVGQLVRMVEQAVDIIPIMPQYKKRPLDSPDFTIWCYANYVRDLFSLPSVEYEEVYRFYEERKKEYDKKYKVTDKNG